MLSLIATSTILFLPATRVGHVPAQLLEPATSATGPSPIGLIIVYALLGALFGALIGVIIALAVSRADRRLRERDEIANSIGVPVLASFPVGHPSDAAGWTRLLEDYKPGALHALQLRRALQQLGTATADIRQRQRSGRWSFAVLSLSSDPGAIALGPQTGGLRRGPGDSHRPRHRLRSKNADVTATLRTACAVPPSASSKRPSHLQVTVSDGDVDAQPGAVLTVVVVVVDDRSPRVPRYDAHHRDRARGFSRCGHGRAAGPGGRERGRRRPRNRRDPGGGSRPSGSDDRPSAAAGTAGTATENAHAYIWHNDGDQKVTDGDQTIIFSMNGDNGSPGAS